MARTRIYADANEKQRVYARKKRASDARDIALGRGAKRLIEMARSIGVAAQSSSDAEVLEKVGSLLADGAVQFEKSDVPTT